MLLAKIQTTKVAYHTYPLPDVIQPNMVLKGIPPIVPVDKIQADLTAQELWVVKVSHIMKTDKATQTLITKYPVFVVTLQTGTDISEIQQIKKLCHIIQWEKYKNSKSVCQCFNCQSFDHSSHFCGKPPQVCHMQSTTWNARMQTKHWHASKMCQLQQSPPSQFYRPSFISTIQLTLTATVPPEADNTCFSVQASSLSSSQAADVSTPAA